MEGSMDLNDIKIKSAISDYLGGGEASSRSMTEFKKLTDMYIYNFPRAAYRKDMDTCSEFYIYMIERLEGVIKNFPLEEDLLFKTWFNYVLRNQFSHFMRFQKKQAIHYLRIEDHETKQPRRCLKPRGGIIHSCMNACRTSGRSRGCRLSSFICLFL